MALELWGGIECSRVHLEDRTVDQIDLSGHSVRRSDMGLLAELGLDAVRYPVLLGRVAAAGLSAPDWSWTDERLAHLKRLGIRPITTLVHHGTRYRDLDIRDHAYAVAVAQHAAAVARRYPWLSDYTPINEPLTTARFGCLYGFWYPHTRSEPDFMRGLVTLCRATVMSMKAVREVNPAARLIHTEDLGWSHGTELLSHQADFENERRWLGLDLLCGRVDEQHPLHHRLIEMGIDERELAWFLENPCPPDVLGWDYYLTSERVLDERLDRYPPWSHGGNYELGYADVHIGMAPEFQPRGREQLLMDAWERLHIPLALTEVHVAAPPPDQVTWFEEACETSERLLASGVDMRAVCAWALFGSFEWNSLMVRCDGVYEAGAFDVSSGKPVRTALATAVRRLSARNKAPVAG